MYQKEIIYLTLSKKGEKLGNAGYVRVENREGKYHLSMQIQNLPESLTGVFAISLRRQDGWEEIDTITIKGGKGVWQKQNMQIENGVWLQIPMGEGYLLGGKSKYVKEPGSAKRTEPARESIPVREAATDNKPMPVRESEVARETMPVRESGTVRESTPVRNLEVVREAGVIREPEAAGNSERVEKIETARESGTISKSEAAQMPAIETITTAAELNNKQQNVVKEDKWEQILETYDTIHPYGDQRVYVKIEPKDFIILQGKYQHLVNNSFLLHGFYNYRYLILGKEGDFYLGVPGVYYEREKMVAVMFGFEAFECEGGHASAGDFGYYLRKVEL